MSTRSKIVKKCLSCFYRSVFFLLAFPLAVNSSAAGSAAEFSFPQSSEFLSVPAEKVTAAPLPDGKIDNNEYGEGEALSSFSGLYFSDADGFEVTETQKEAYKNINETILVSFDDRYFYVALKLVSPEGRLGIYDHGLYGKVFSVSISLGFTKEEDLLSRQATLNNCYYFSCDSVEPVEVSGTRLRKENDSLKNVLQISSSVKAFQDRGFVDEEKTLWNGAKYCKEAAAFLNDKGSEISFECRIPVGDVLLCLKEEDRPDILSSLKDEETFFGSFLSQISVNSLTGSSPMLVTSGISAKSECTCVDSGETWNEVFISGLGLPRATAYAIDWIMTPLSFGGENSNENESRPITPDVSKNNIPGTNNKNNGETEVDVLVTPPPVSFGQAFVDHSQNEGLVEDESVFEGLPETGENIPEHTEILPLEPEDEEETSSIWGSVLPFITGILMLVSVLIIAIIFFHKEKEEKNAEKSKKKK